MSYLHSTYWPASLLVALLAANQSSAECAAALSLNGVGAAVARQVKPYVVCLNSTVGTQEQIRSLCSGARATAAHIDNIKIDKAKLDRAVRWLDAMAEERATCETRLDVEA